MHDIQIRQFDADFRSPIWLAMDVINTTELKTKTFANGYKISYRNDCELEVIYDDIFTKNTYFFETENPEPRIIDCGGHIGLAVLYFKSLYPRAKDCDL